MKQTLYFLVSARGKKHGIAYDTVIGRSSTCDISLDNIMVSRRHAVLHVDQDRLEVEDLGSSNGTFVGNERISGRRALKVGDSIMFGDASFTIETNVDTDLAPLTIVEAPALGAEGASPVEDPGAPAAMEPDVVAEKPSAAQPTPEEAVKPKAGKASKPAKKPLKVEPDVVAQKPSAAQPTPEEAVKPKAGKASGRAKKPLKKDAQNESVPVDPGSEGAKSQPSAPPGGQSNDSAKKDGGSSGGNNGENDEKLGKIEVLPLAQNLPPAWMSDAAGGTVGTVVLTPGDIDSDSQLAAMDAFTDHDQFKDGATLVFLNGSDAGRPYRLLNSADFCYWMIGKDPEKCELSIVAEHDTVSSPHAKVIHKNGQWKIVDQMALNHTRVNGDIYASKFLSSGDTITLGVIKMRFILPAAQQPVADPPKPSGILAFFRKLFARRTES